MAQSIIKAAMADRLSLPGSRARDGRFVFGKLHTAAEAVGKIREWRVHEKEEGWPDGQPWSVWDTKLHAYAGGLLQGQLNFEEYLVRKIAEAAVNGEILRVLDVGMGSGDQWVGFLKMHKVEFFGTALTMGHVNPALRERVRLCTAASLHKKFAANSFDVVVTHYGAHYQELEAIENAIYVLKNGGEAVLVFQDAVLMEVKIAALVGGRFEFVDETRNNGKHALLHIRKLR